MLSYDVQLAHFALSPADATTYFLGGSSAEVAATVEGDVVRQIVPVAGSVERLVIAVVRTGTAPDAVDLNLTFRLRVNGVDVDANRTVALAGGGGPVQATVLNIDLTGAPIALAAGDYLTCSMVTPTWATTNPTGLLAVVTAYVEITGDEAAVVAAQSDADVNAAAILTNDSDISANQAQILTNDSDISSILATVVAGDLTAEERASLRHYTLFQRATARAGAMLTRKGGSN